METQKQVPFDEQIAQIVEDLRSAGTSDQLLKLIPPFAKLQKTFLPEASILGWFKDQVTIAKASSVKTD